MGRPYDESGSGDDNLCRMARNVASIAAIPWEALADGPARGCLLEMAYAGLDVSAFETRSGCWHIRMRGSELSCAEWAARFAV